MEYLRVEGAGVAMEGQSVAFSSDAGRAARDLALKVSFLAYCYVYYTVRLVFIHIVA